MEFLVKNWDVILAGIFLAIILGEITVGNDFNWILARDTKDEEENKNKEG